MYPRKILRGIWKNGFQEAARPTNAEKNENRQKNHEKSYLNLYFLHERHTGASQNSPEWKKT